MDARRYRWMLRRFFLFACECALLFFGTIVSLGLAAALAGEGTWSGRVALSAFALSGIAVMAAFVRLRGIEIP